MDNLITRLVQARLARPDALAALAPDPEAARDKLSESEALRARLDLAADQFAEGVIDGPQLARITARLRPQLETAKRQMRGAVASPDLADLAGPDLSSRWDALPIERQRAVIDLLMVVRIKPAAKKGRAQINPADISVEWRDEAGSAAPRGARSPAQEQR